MWTTRFCPDLTLSHCYHLAGRVGVHAVTLRLTLVQRGTPTSTIFDIEDPLFALMLSRATTERDIAQKHYEDLERRHRRTLPQTLERLACGEILEERDDECIAAMGDALVAAANERSSGYGTDSQIRKPSGNCIFSPTALTLNCCLRCR